MSDPGIIMFYGLHVFFAVWLYGLAWLCGAFGPGNNAGRE